MSVKEVALISLVLTPATAFRTFAQAEMTPAASNLIVGLLGNVGIVGALIWYMWYQTTKSQPKMLETFAAQLEAQRTMAATQMEAQRLSSEAKYEKMRVAFETQIERMRSVFESQQDKLREHAERERQNSARELAEMRNVMMEMAKNMRTAVHDIKDTANVAIQKSSAAELQARREKGDSNHGS